MLARVAMLLLTGACLALLGLAAGLADFVEAPSLPGTRAEAGLMTAHFVPRGSRRGHADRLSLRQVVEIETALPVGAQLITAHLTQRPLGFAGRPGRSLRIAFVSGPLWQALGVQVTGTVGPWPDLRASLPGGGERSLVLSESLAIAEFGSIEAALGQRVQVPDLMKFMTAGTVDFVVVGVATGGFKGPIAEDQVDAWLPLQAWHGVILPAHQADDVADEPPDFVAISGTAGQAQLSGIINHALRQDPELDHQVQLLSGVGPAPERRMALQEFASMLRAAALTVALALAGLHVCQRWLLLERARHQDYIRRCLGETSAGWWKRKLLTLLVDLALLLGALTGATLLLWWFGAAVPMPVHEAIRQCFRLDLGLLVAAATVLAIVLAPLVLHLSLGESSGAFAHRLGSHAFMLVGVAMATTLLGAQLAVLSVQHTNYLIERQLGWPAQARWEAELRPPGEDARALARHGLDSRPLAPLLAGLPANVGLAMASMAPIGLSDAVQAQVRAGDGEWRGRLQLNEITPGYLELLGLDVRGNCPQARDMPADTVIVNDAFLRRHVPAGIPPHAIDLRLTILAEGITPQSVRVCGSVGDVQYGDARGAPLPVVYRYARRIGAVRSVIASDPASIEVLRSVLQGTYPDLRLARAERLSDLIAADLIQESAMARFAMLIAAATAMIAMLLTAQVLLLAMQLQASTLAIRWALGARRLKLLQRPLRPDTWWPPLIVLAMLAAATLIGMNAVPPQSAAAGGIALLIAFAAVAAGVIVGMVPGWRWLSESRLHRALAGLRQG